VEYKALVASGEWLTEKRRAFRRFKTAFAPRRLFERAGVYQAWGLAASRPTVPEGGGDEEALPDGGGGGSKEATHHPRLLPTPRTPPAARHTSISPAPAVSGRQRSFLFAVGVLSSPAYLERRLAIRASWMDAAWTPGRGTALIKFVLRSGEVRCRAGVQRHTQPRCVCVRVRLRAVLQWVLARCWLRGMCLLPGVWLLGMCLLPGMCALRGFDAGYSVAGI
jgi:hypothetical protein